MKKLFTLFVIVAITISVFAQSPQKMSYQCVVRNASGVLMTSQSIRIRISILQGTSTGTVVYTETQTPTTNANGLVSIEIGGGTGFDVINWASGPYFLKTETDPTGGTNYTIVGTSQLLSVPYALYTKSAETATDAVKITGNQTISGIKTFSNDLLINGLTVGLGKSAVSSNSVVGDQALYSNLTGIGNTANGMAALYSNKAGNYNTAIGMDALYSNTTNGNTAVGCQALYLNTTGYSNTANGHQALYTNTTGNSNTVNGFEALFSNTTANNNTATGSQTLYTNITGYSNTADGALALYSNTTGSGNAANGSEALYSNTTGSGNSAFGFLAGSTVTTGNNLTLIGDNAQPSTPDATSQITLGNAYVTSLRCNVQNITSLSDSRDKKYITDLSLGLDFIMKIKPRQFNWDRRDWYANNQSDGSKMQQTLTAGFVAQELDEVQKGANAEWLNLVLKDNPEKLEATNGNLLPIVVKAIQEQQMQIEKLKKEIALLKSR